MVPTTFVTTKQCWAPDVPFYLVDLESESEPPNRVSSPDLLYTYISVDPRREILYKVRRYLYKVSFPDPDQQAWYQPVETRIRP